jgi:hypothetical protein
VLKGGKRLLRALVVSQLALWDEVSQISTILIFRENTHQLSKKTERNRELRESLAMSTENAHWHPRE